MGAIGPQAVRWRGERFDAQCLVELLVDHPDLGVALDTQPGSAGPAQRGRRRQAREDVVPGTPPEVLAQLTGDAGLHRLVPPPWFDVEFDPLVALPAEGPRLAQRDRQPDPALVVDQHWPPRVRDRSTSVNTSPSRRRR
ncbi:MAG: hypothetical protein JJE50_01895 [Actinomycetales bacterium]|nr:hypothetical protein [Actinomycetales bacterium]